MAICLSEVEAAHAGSGVPKTACALLEYGAEKDGYWNSEQFMVNVADAVAIAEFKHHYLFSITTAATKPLQKMPTI